MSAINLRRNRPGCERSSARTVVLQNTPLRRKSHALEVDESGKWVRGQTRLDDDDDADVDDDEGEGAAKEAAAKTAAAAELLIPAISPSRRASSVGTMIPEP